MRNYIASLVLCCWITYCSAQKYYSAAENDFVSLVHNIENGEEKFPQTVVIEFEQRGVRHRFTLSRDDSSTALLSESVFHTSRSLPSDVYRDEDHENFAAYDGGSNFVLHRETNTSPLKVYGGFTKQGENMVVRAMDGLHRVVRASDLHRRQKRSANSFNREDLALNSSAQVIELFMFADLSIWDHFQNNDLLPGTSNEADKLVIRDYMESLTRDVDRVFNEEGYPGFRVYFMDYQVITQASHQQAWTTNNLNDPLLTEGAITDFVAYYDKLVNKFDFPEPDHIMMLTNPSESGVTSTPELPTTCGNAASNVGDGLLRVIGYSGSSRLAI